MFFADMVYPTFSLAGQCAHPDVVFAVVAVPVGVLVPDVLVRPHGRSQRPAAAAAGQLALRT